MYVIDRVLKRRPVWTNKSALCAKPWYIFKLWINLEHGFRLSMRSLCSLDPSIQSVSSFDNLLIHSLLRKSLLFPFSLVHVRLLSCADRQTLSLILSSTIEFVKLEAFFCPHKSVNSRVTKLVNCIQEIMMVIMPPRMHPCTSYATFCFSFLCANRWWRNYRSMNPDCIITSPRKWGQNISLGNYMISPWSSKLFSMLSGGAMTTLSYVTPTTRWPLTRQIPKFQQP